MGIPTLCDKVTVISELFSSFGPTRSGSTTISAFVKPAYRQAGLASLWLCGMFKGVNSSNSNFRAAAGLVRFVPVKERLLQFKIPAHALFAFSIKFIVLYLHIEP